MTAGEALGFMALDGWAVLGTLLKTLIVIMIPGYLLTLALFPKKDDLEFSERFALSFALGLTPVFLLTTLNLVLNFKINFFTDLIMVLIVSAIGILGYVYRGGELNIMGKTLLKPYRTG
ncbi:MAG: DUF1616 domain-containing protein [Candidatus Altiarchaeota archaeon]|nr:DUF1616 domain-containing protein [Candidatus Altiarchaeota archaeon]